MVTNKVTRLNFSRSSNYRVHPAPILGVWSKQLILWVGGAASLCQVISPRTFIIQAVAEFIFRIHIVRVLFITILFSQKNFSRL